MHDRTRRSASLHSRGNRRFPRHEWVLLTLVLVLGAGISLVNPAFLSLGNLFSLGKSSVTIGLLAIGALIVLISGQIDISFPAVAAFSMYVTCLIGGAVAFANQLPILFVTAAALGAALGLLNAVFVHHFQMPALIVTLGTGSLIRGGLLAFVGTRILTDLPSSLVSFSKAELFQQRLPGGERIGLAVSVLLLVAVAVLVWFLLNRTVLGRGVYALGGDAEAARRVGFNLRNLQYLIYGAAGSLAGLAGIVHASHLRNANPFDLAGIELTVIAAVVLGGASITGGRGTIAGTLLGVLLLVIINHSLILVGIPSLWQKVVLGLIIIASTGLTARRSRQPELS